MLFSHSKPEAAGIKVVILALLTGLMAVGVVSAGQVILPSSDKILMQTNGPDAEFDDGDWWSHKDYGYDVHLFLVEVPPGTDPDFVVELTLFDPECYSTDPSSNFDTDEQKWGAWENTTFTLYSPTHAQIYTKVYWGGDVSTNQQWVDYYSFRVGDWGTGMYQIEVFVAGDDQNGYKIGLKNGDADGDPSNGNEIRLWAKRAAFQMVGEGNLCNTFRFKVPANMPVLHLYNFDLDANGATVTYVSPSGVIIPGTASGEAVWNTQPPQAELPSGDADAVINPEEGWWQARICVHHPTQYVRDGNQFIFWPNDLPFNGSPDEENGRIGDRVWVDENMNGLQDEGEIGLSNVTVRLLDGATDMAIRTTTTDWYGHYVFENVAPGTYRVEFILPANFFFTAPLIGSDGTVDSDAIPPEGRSNIISLTAGQVNLDIDAGMIAKNVSDLRVEKTIQGSDRIRPNEEAVFIISVTNLGPDEATHVRISDQIPPGLTFIGAQRAQDFGPNPLIWYESSIAVNQTIAYEVQVRAEESLGTFNNCAFVSSPNKDENLNNNIACAALYVEEGGYQGSNITIGDRVWIDENKNGLQDDGEPGRANVHVHLLDGTTPTLVAQTTTDLNGHYTFVDVPAGSYRLEFVLPDGYHFTLRDQGGDDDLDSDADPASGLTDMFTVVNDQQYLHWDAGIMENEQADLEVMKTIEGERTYFYINEEIEFVITVSNNGPDDAYDVTVIDNLPDGLAFVSATRPQDEGPNPLIWREAVIPVGGSVTYRVVMRATEELGGMDNCATATGTTLDADMQNNIACVQLHVLVPVELSSFTATSYKDHIALHWITQSESENMGFHILRAESEDGKYLQITKEIIPGAGTSSSVHSYSYTDEKPTPEITYYYKLADVDYQGRINLHGPISAKVQPPDVYSLEQNYPNPFNPDTKINFTLKDAGQVQLKVFNVKGELVKTLLSRSMNAGSHMVVWDGKDDNGKLMTSGLYIYTLRINNHEEKRTMMLLK